MRDNYIPGCICPHCAEAKAAGKPIQPARMEVPDEVWADFIPYQSSKEGTMEANWTMTDLGEWILKKRAELDAVYAGAFMYGIPYGFANPAPEEPVKPQFQELTHVEQLDAMISCIRESAQGTLENLQRKGFVLVKR